MCSPKERRGGGSLGFLFSPHVCHTGGRKGPQPGNNQQAQTKMPPQKPAPQLKDQEVKDQEGEQSFSRIAKEKREDTNFNIRHKRGNITIDTTDIKRIRECYK